MYHWEWSVTSRDETTDLSHHRHQRNRSDVGTLPAHVASSNNLESSLLTGVNIVWDKFLFVSPFSNRMTAKRKLINDPNVRLDWPVEIPRFDGNTIQNFRSSIFFIRCDLPMFNQSPISTNCLVGWMSGPRATKINRAVLRETNQLAKGSNHIKHSDTFTNTKEGWNLASNLIK